MFSGVNGRLRGVDRARPCRRICGNCGRSGISGIRNAFLKALKLLIYTIAVDAPREACHQTMAKILAASIVRSGLGEDVLVFFD
jgi:hypothetical protein